LEAAAKTMPLNKHFQAQLPRRSSVKQAYNTPAVALDKDTRKVLRRWERGGNSHWIVGQKKSINGVTYELKDIVQTTGVNYLICERRNGSPDHRPGLPDRIRGGDNEPGLGDGEDPGGDG
jgi:hypothetical protein